jgi:hypothetical protein
MAPLRILEEKVASYLKLMNLTPRRSNDGLYLFKYGSTVVTLSLFAQSERTWCRFASIVLEETEPTLELLQRLLKLNTEVLFGSFLLFEDNSLSFSATLLGDHLDFDEFEVTLRYVAKISDDHDDALQQLAGGKRAADILQQG